MHPAPDSPSPYVCVIGGSNIDIEGYPHEQLIPGDSNPGIVRTSLGGVGRNIAENLTRLGIPTTFLSVVGNDAYGQRILGHARSIGLDMAKTLVVDEPTSTYLAVLDATRDMYVGIAHMDILHRLDIPYIQRHADLIQNAAFCVVDTNLPDVLEYLVTTYDVPFILETVSANKAIKAQPFLGRFHTIKSNRIEAQVLSGMTIRTTHDLQKAGRYFIDRGVGNVFITLGSEGVYYRTPDSEGILTSPSVEMVSATGAGDAFAAGLVYGLYRGNAVEDEVRFAMGASIMTILSEETIHPKISPERIETLIQDMDFTHQKL